MRTVLRGCPDGMNGMRSGSVRSAAGRRGIALLVFRAGMDILDDLEKGMEYVCEISYGREGLTDVDEYKEWYLPRRVYIQP